MRVRKDVEERGREPLGTLAGNGVNCKILQLLSNIVRRVLKTLRLEPPHDPPELPTVRPNYPSGYAPERMEHVSKHSLLGSRRREAIDDTSERRTS